VEAGLGDKVAFYWEGNDVGVDATLTYNDVLERVCQVWILYVLSSIQILRNGLELTAVKKFAYLWVALSEHTFMLGSCFPFNVKRIKCSY